MKQTTTALCILERELVRQIIKLAAEGPLAQPVPPQPVKPTTADPVAKPIKPIAQMGKTTGAPASRSMFDRQGPGDAQARAAIYDKTKQLGSQLGSQIHGASSRVGDYVGSMLPVGRPGNSGIGNRPMSMADEMRGTFKQMGSDVQQIGAAVNSASSRVGDYVGSMLPVGKPGNSGFGNTPPVYAYGAAPQQGPMGTGIPGPGQAPAAYGAAPPQGPMGPAAPATPTIPPFTPSPEMQQFLTDNNIRTKNDLGNLTEEQQLQFNDLYEKQQQQPAQAATPAQPPEQQQTVPDSVRAWGGSLPEQATPEQRDQANQAQQQLADKSPEEKQELSTAINEPKSPAAQKLNANGANNYVTEAAANPNDPPPTDPKGYGAWAQGKLNEFGQLDPMAQLAIGAGLSIGVVSMLSSMMGGGGMGTMLLGALGLGTAGLVGASTGMLGNDAKGWVNDAFSGLVTAFGGNVPNEADIRARLETAAKQGPEAAKAELEKVRGEVKPYAAFSQDAGKFLNDSADPNYLYNQAKGYGRDNYAELAPQSTSYGIPTGAITSAIFGKPTMEDADPNNRTWNEWAWGAPGSAQREKNVETGVQRKGFKEVRSSVAAAVMQKAARCWAGYEPVPGKKPYSNNSCRPKSKTKKKTEKKADASCIAVMRKAARCWAGYEPVPGAKAYSEGSCRPKGSKKTKKEVIQGKNHSPAK
jgi:hypothetical protein